MSALSIFLGEFWPPFIGASIGLFLAWMGMRSRSKGYLPFIGPKSFSELSGFAEDHQKQLLHEASAEAFQGWRSVVPSVIFAGFLALGVALGRTLPVYTKVPNSYWMHAGFAIFFGALGGWVASQLGVHYVTAFLKAAIERRGYVA